MLIEKGELDDLVTAAVLEALADPAIYGRLRAEGKTSDAEVRAAEGEVAALRATLQDYRQRARRREIDADDFAEISAGLKIDIRDAERRAERAGLPPAIRPYLEPGVDVAKRWANDTVQAKRDVIRTLFTVTVRPIGRAGRGTPIEDRVDIEPVIPGATDK